MLPRSWKAVRKPGIPVEEISINQMLGEEPLLNPKIKRCFRVPDASANSFLAADLNAKSARQYGALVLTYHEVLRLITQGNRASPGSGDFRVTGAVCHDLVKDEEYRDLCRYGGECFGSLGRQNCFLCRDSDSIRPGKGTMVAINHRVVNTVINRCKMPADGDIIVPAHTVAVIGTTDEQVSDPDHFAIEDWEIKLMLDEGEKLIPGFRNLRLLRSWAGVRPLYQETNLNQSRDITRAYVLLDHDDRDGVGGTCDHNKREMDNVSKNGRSHCRQSVRKAKNTAPLPHTAGGPALSCATSPLPGIKIGACGGAKRLSKHNLRMRAGYFFRN